MKQENKRPYEKVKTSELLDFTGKKIPYTKDKERDKQADYKDELELREPFAEIKRKVDRMDGQIRHIQDVVENLLRHQHGDHGEVTIPLKQHVGPRQFL